MVDETQIVKDRVRFSKGQVPCVEIIAQKINNKKQTTITGLELFMIDLDELSTYLQHKCASSVTMNEIEFVSTPKNPKFIIKIQGAQIKLIEEILSEKFKVPKKYFVSKDNCGQKKKR
mmetsp:Transcript_15122/g.25649  ORF Transcript_15122/g.25649 Transcript_15122/m.25649 type:complete len:118 (-) Transcript_15122:116-469(-)